MDQLELYDEDEDVHVLPGGRGEEVEEYRWSRHHLRTRRDIQDIPGKMFSRTK